MVFDRRLEVLRWAQHNIVTPRLERLGQSDEGLRIAARAKR